MHTEVNVANEAGIAPSPDEAKTIHKLQIPADFRSSLCFTVVAHGRPH